MKKKDLFCEFELAYYLFEKGRHKQAFESFVELSNQGELDSRCYVAHMYGEGIGVKLDKKKAIKLYKTCIKPSTDLLMAQAAANNIAILYKELGNIHWSIYWFKKALLYGYEDVKEDLYLLTGEAIYKK